MPIPTREELKAYLETGDTPTESQFHEIIDAIYDLAQSSQDTADEALAIVTDLIPKVARCFGLIQFNQGNPGTYTVLKDIGCSVAATITIYGAGVEHYNITVTITPDEDFDDDDFVVSALSAKLDETQNTTHGINVSTRATNQCVLAFQMQINSGSSKEFDFAIFD